jgi:alkanesulfonate monooxygenase SsuD/methylene tetrahydromethanopterin reductase-like flavin-dependent oxidoreductase (luciferase family)
VEAGLAKAGKTIDSFDIAPTVSVVINDNLDIAYNMLRPFLALYVGGMGARGKNFYYDLAARYGFEAAAAEIQDLYLAGDKGAAMARVPAALIDAVALVGPRERVRERLSIWRDSPVTTLNMTVFDVETLRTMVELVERDWANPDERIRNGKQCGRHATSRSKSPGARRRWSS